ncbi:MAG: glutamate-5-semialdehyde dehydrogenase [Myxococcales bacterium]
MTSPERKLAAMELAERARVASRALAVSTSDQRARALRLFADQLGSPEVASAIAAANEADLRAAAAAGKNAAFIDRLRIDGKRLAALATAVRDVANLPDPVGEVVEHSVRPNGLRVDRVRAPLGVILMIYESRPGVTSDAAALCLRSGNAVLLRGGSEALQTSSVLLEACQRALEAAGLPEDAAQIVPPDRQLLDEMLQLEDSIDLCIPRGGPSLIRFIAERSRIPVIKHYQGVCHLYVAPDADLDLAARLTVDGKAERPGVCNALECLLVDARIASDALPRIAGAVRARGVELRADERALRILGSAAIPATADDFGKEFLDLKLAVAVVDGIEGALGHIARYGSRHTEAICTKDGEVAERFLREVDASCVVWNASTRFNDGGELGLGAEIGISTSKLHAYGPMGLRELTCTRFVVRGEGQVRK